MKNILLPLLLAAAVAACAQPTNPTSEGKPTSSMPSASFAGSWQSCAGAEAPDQCSRYLLVQRGERICGTWSHFASGNVYEGRVVAEAVSPTEARRTRICGRPSSETRTQCEDGWETIDRPLRLCGDKLGDLDGKDGHCFADFERAARPDPALTALEAQPWVEACLSDMKEASK